jgi:glycerophosphoryl diester phosphodiesterase
VDWTTPGLGLRIGGHRGAAGEAPENTYAGFVAAADAGVEYLELDVQLSSDGTAMVFHDEDLDRTTDGTGPFGAHSSRELLKLDAGAWFGPDYRDERVPTLDGFLAWLAERPGLGATIEAKGPSTGGPIVRAIALSGMRRACSICSFSPDELRAAAAEDPSIPRMLIVDRDEPDADLLALAAAAGVGAINVPLDWVTGTAVARLHAAGLLVAGGTVDDAAGIRTCLDLGVDLVDTNRPAVTVPARNALFGRGSVER